MSMVCLTKPALSVFIVRFQDNAFTVYEFLLCQIVSKVNKWYEHPSPYLLVTYLVASLLEVPACMMPTYAEVVCILDIR